MTEKIPWQRFVKMLRLKGKARIQLSTKIFHQNRLAVDYQATFAAIRNSSVAKFTTDLPGFPLLVFRCAPSPTTPIVSMIAYTHFFIIDAGFTILGRLTNDI